MKLKAWQIAVIVIGLTVGVGSLAYQLFFTDDVGLEHRYHLIDVETGQIYEVDSTKYRLILPARHPDTGKIALVGVTKDDDGTWFVPKRDLDSVAELDKSVQVKAIDPKSGDVTINLGAPKAYVKAK